MADEKKEERKELSREEIQQRNEDFRKRRDDYLARRLEVSKELLKVIDAHISAGEDVIIPASAFKNGRFILRKESVNSAENFRTRTLLQFARYFDSALKTINNNRINIEDIKKSGEIEERFANIISDLDSLANYTSESFKERSFAGKVKYNRTALVAELIKVMQPLTDDVIEGKKKGKSKAEEHTDAAA